MTYVVGEGCIACKYTDCVEVCPVDCFHEGPNFLVIDPEECIDCSLCEPECPAEAIYAEDDLPSDQSHFLKLNEELSEEWPVIWPIPAIMSLVRSLQKKVVTAISEPRWTAASKASP